MPAARHRLGDARAGAAIATAGDPRSALCDLHALAMQDRIFLGDRFVNPDYEARRKGLFVLAINCGRAASTCFCTSMGTGPAVSSGFDLALTELPGHFVLEVGTELGGRVAAAAPWVPCSTREIAEAQAVPRKAEIEMEERRRPMSGQPHGRYLDTNGVHDLLLNNLDHDHWDEVADRCLACGNCTMVCPTCFCCSVQEVADLTGSHVRRERFWDTCFNARPLVHEQRDGAQAHPGPLPPVAHAQAGQLDRPVRQLRLRRLRPVHHLVSGRDRPDRGSRRHPRRRPTVTAIAPMPSEPSVNPWLPKAVTIGDIQPEVPGIVTYQLDFADDLAAAAFSFRPGQFNMVYLPGIGEVPISISSDPTGAGPLLHTIRAAGSVTSALGRKQVGETLGLRGPFGSSWPTGNCKAQDIVIACGGVGLAPLRPAIYDIVRNRGLRPRLPAVRGPYAGRPALRPRVRNLAQCRHRDVHHGRSRRRPLAGKHRRPARAGPAAPSSPASTTRKTPSSPTASAVWVFN